MAILIPLIVILVYMAYRFFSSRSDQKETETGPTTNMTLTKANEGLGDEFERLSYPAPKETDVD